MLKSYDEALQDFSKAIDIEPTNGENYYFRAVAYISLEKPEQSCADLKKSMSLNYQPAHDLFIENCK